ncbi:MAG: type II secretion system protein J [Candidatus Omnitrophota bacterium]
MKNKIGKVSRMIRRNRGTTLVETLVVVLIFSVLVAGFYSIATVGDNSWQVNRVQVELQQELRKSMDAMVNDLRQAGSSSIIDVPANGNWYNSITFRIPEGVVAGSIDWTDSTLQFLRAGPGTVQLQRIYGVQTKIVSNNITSLQFRRLTTSPKKLEVMLQAQKNTLKGLPIIYNLNFNVQLRN